MFGSLAAHRMLLLVPGGLLSILFGKRLVYFGFSLMFDRDSLVVLGQLQVISRCLRRGCEPFCFG